MGDFFQGGRGSGNALVDNISKMFVKISVKIF